MQDCRFSGFGTSNHAAFGWGKCGLIGEGGFRSFSLVVRGSFREGGSWGSVCIYLNLREALGAGRSRGGPYNIMSFFFWGGGGG